MNLKGNGHLETLEFSRPPQRVISLVPSMTESLFDLGLGTSLVGITDFCVYPEDKVTALPHVGGTKNPSLEKILSLQPDLIIANQEENPQHIITELEASGVKVWVTFPKTIRQAVDVLWAVVGIFQNRSAAVRLETLEITLDWAESALLERLTWRYFCPIWMEPGIGENVPDWWMTFNQDTYMNDVLRLMGGLNVFSKRERRYPLAADMGRMPPEDPGIRDMRYPRVTKKEILDMDPEVILLPDEPYAFNEVDQENNLKIFKDTSAGQQGKVILVEGSLLSWHGTRLAKALDVLPVIL